MKLKIGFASTALPLILAAASFGCSSSTDDTPSGPKKLEVYSWLVTGAEQIALNNLFDVVKARVPGIEIVNAAQGRSDDARKELPMRLAAGNPPDSFQAIGGADLLEWQKKNALEPLDAIADAEGWRTAFGEGVLKSVTGLDGHIYGVPLNLERDNTLFYNINVLTAAGVDPTTIGTVDGFLAAAEKIKAIGKIPLAISDSGGWTIASHVFEAMLPLEGGAAFYEKYLKGEAQSDDPIIIKTLNDTASMLDYGNPDRATTGWGDAVKMVCNESAGMLFLPDFTKGQFQQTGGCDTTIGYVPMQAAGEKTFVYVGITFPVTLGAPDHDMAVEFVKAVGSKEAQEKFNVVKGSVAARRDVDGMAFDSISQGTLKDLAADGEIAVPGYAALTSSTYQGAVNPALQAFVDPGSPVYKDVNALLTIMKAQYANIKP